MSRRPRVIVSGGQTGVDRGALDAALALDVSCGGWCPKGRLAEDGPIPSRYPLREVEQGGYAERTRRNVADSDGTCVLVFPGMGPGTRLTLEAARALGKPLLTIEAGKCGTDAQAERIRQFVERHGIRTLNMAGPRESERPGAQELAREVVAAVLSCRGERARDTRRGPSVARSASAAGRANRDKNG